MHAYVYVYASSHMDARICDVMLVRACMRMRRYEYCVMCTQLFVLRCWWWCCGVYVCQSVSAFVCVLTHVCVSVVAVVLCLLVVDAVMRVDVRARSRSVGGSYGRCRM